TSLSTIRNVLGTVRDTVGKDALSDLFTFITSYTGHLPRLILESLDRLHDLGSLCYDGGSWVWQKPARQDCLYAASIGRCLSSQLAELTAKEQNVLNILAVSGETTFAEIVNLSSLPIEVVEDTIRALEKVGLIEAKGSLSSLSLTLIRKGLRDTILRLSETD